ncbi:MAG: amidohydrolase family protein [Planctomycetaceae bacterium]|nr:amidohydrolase family protein [Planctomycetaceae bacterium]
MDNSLGARWIHTMLGPPLENHWVNITDGKVESISPKPAHRHAEHLGERSQILPAMLNAHAHLELSQLPAPLDVPSRSMADWVAALLAFRRSPEYSAVQGIQHALRRPELRESTIAVADIVNGRDSLAYASGSMPAILPFVELIGWRRDVIDVNSVTTNSFGLSPHAPHTVCQELLQRAVEQQVPLAMHLAETQEELQLLRHHTGPLLDMMRRADPNYDPKSVLIGKRPRDYLQLLSSAPNAFVIHGNYLDDEELRFLASRRETMSVVYCPRSHAYFRHSAYPLQKMLDMGVRVLLGTDSLASVSDLSMLAEVRFAMEQHPGTLPESIYRMGTASGAEAFGLLSEGFGIIQPGGPARFAVIVG